MEAVHLLVLGGVKRKKKKKRKNKINKKYLIIKNICIKNRKLSVLLCYNKFNKLQFRRNKKFMKNILIHGLGQDNQSWNNTNIYLKKKWN